MSGKGDLPRNCFSEAFRSGWERIFGGEKKSTEDTQDAGAVPATSTKKPGHGAILGAASVGVKLNTSTFVKPSENVNEYEHEIDWSND